MALRRLVAFVALSVIVSATAGAPRAAVAAGVVQIGALGVAYTQDFNGLATTGTANTALPDGWYLHESGTSTRVNAAYAASSGTDNAGDVYSFGAASATERAIGGLLSSSLTPVFGASFRNASGAAASHLLISYTGEQWRLGATGRADRIDFQYSLSATSLTSGTWVDVDALDFASPVTSGTVGALSGNAAGNRAARSATIAVTIPDGASFWIRWADFNASGADDGLAVDDLSLSLADESAPAVSGTAPAADANGVPLSANISITFTEPVAVGAGWFAIDCDTSGSHAANVSGGPLTFMLDPTSDLAPAEECTVTVYADRVTDLDTVDPPDPMSSDLRFSFETEDTSACGSAATRIHAVQGSGAASPLAGSRVTLEGVVTGDHQGAGQFSGFYMQEEDADRDADPATSEGIFVFSSLPASAGDVVRVRGTVTEFFELTEIANVSRVTVCASGAAVSASTLLLPVADLADFERYEGMLVRFEQTLVVNETFNLGRFGELKLADTRLYVPTAVVPPGTAAADHAALNARRSFLLDDGNSDQNIDPTIHPPGGLSAAETIRSGDTVGGLVGVFDFRFGSYRLQPVGPVSFSASNPRTAAPAAVGGNTKVASFNVLNYFNGDGLGGGFPTSRGASSPFELGRQTAKIVSALRAMDADIVGLMEIENDAGPNSALAQLVGALNAAIGSAVYSYVDTGAIGTDEIKVALIYKTATVAPAGPWSRLDAAVDPRFDSSRNRPALAQTFQRTGTTEKVTVAVNHLKSKGSACAGDPDAGDGQGNCNGTRTAAAQALLDWIATDPTSSGDPDFLLIGDLNSYTFEDPITTLTSGGLTNLVRALGGLSAYSYVFNGEAGYLDHALATASLVPSVRGVTEWHINADEPRVLDYTDDFKSVGHVTTLYAPDAYRSSDHDPVIVGLDLRSTPASVCAVTLEIVPAKGLARSLCAKLAAAEAAEARGNAAARANQVEAYMNEVSALRGKAISTTDADMLIALAAGL